MGRIFYCGLQGCRCTSRFPDLFLTIPSGYLPFFESNSVGKGEGSDEGKYQEQVAKHWEIEMEQGKECSRR